MSMILPSTYADESFFCPFLLEECITQIHPLNAGFIITSLPYRNYKDEVGNTLEIAVKKLCDEEITQYGADLCIIGIRYQNLSDDIDFTNSFLMDSAGNIRGYHSVVGTLNIGMNLLYLYMLLGVGSVDGWTSRIEGSMSNYHTSNTFAMKSMGMRSLDLPKMSSDLGEKIALVETKVLGALRNNREK